MYTKTTLLALASSVSAYTATSRTFAVNHFYGTGPLTMGRMDPIVDPGEPSGHVHAIQGGSAFALTMSDTEALSSNCTSSLIKADLSNYWTPSLYFHADNGSFISVPMFYMNVYYFFEGTTDKIEAFPVGLRMLSGSNSKRTPPATGGNILDHSQGTIQPVQFTCPKLNGYANAPLYPADSTGTNGVGLQDPNNQGAGAGFPDQNCDGYASPLRADVHFPSCYNPAAGIDNYAENMDWPTNGNCPEGWTHTPHLFYEVYWNTPLFADMWTPGQGKQPFVLSNGDVTGYSLHGDFLAGWDVDALQQIIDNCDAGDSGMDQCPGLEGGVNNSADSCNIESAVDETISGVLEALPGNNPLGVWGGPDLTPGGSPPATSVVASSSKPAATSKPATSQVASSSAVVATSAPVSTVVPTSVAVVSSTKAAVVTSSASHSHHVHKTTSVVVITSTIPAGPSGVASVTEYTTTETIYLTVPAASSTAAPTGGSKVAAGWSYAGCFSDSTSSRVLTGIEFANIGNHEVTNTKCVAYCAAAGYSIAGTEYAGQCFCGNELEGSSAIAETSCSMPCEGDATETCGGGLALSVYSTGAVTTKAKRARSQHVRQHMRHTAF